MKSIEAPVIGGRYPAIASFRFDVSAGKRDFLVLSQAVKQALEGAGLSVTVRDQSLFIAGDYEAHLPAYHMDEAIWKVLVSRGYELGAVTPVPVRNVFSGGQHAARRPRMYIYEELGAFVAKGEGSDTLMDKVRSFAQEYPSSPPDIDHIVARLQEPEYQSQIWAPLMNDTRDIVGRALFSGQGIPDIFYLADSKIAMIEGDVGLEYVPIPNADGNPRYVATWTELIRS